MCEDPHFENCSRPAISVDEADDSICCTSISPTTTAATTTVLMSSTNTVTNASNSDSHQSSHLIYIPVGVVAAVGLAALVLVIPCFIFLWHRRTIDYTPRHKKLPPPPPPPCPVLVVFSPRTRELETQVILQCLVGDLSASPYGIKASTYGMNNLRQNQSEWIVDWHTKANAVLCVCNQEFFEDWTDTDTFADNNQRVVHTLKMLFEGDMQRGASGTNNYAVIKMKPTDDRFIPPLLRHRPVYMCREVEGIARFAHNVPQYCL